MNVFMRRTSVSVSYIRSADFLCGLLRALTIAEIHLVKSTQSYRSTDLGGLHNILDQMSGGFQCTMCAKQPIVRDMLNVPRGSETVQDPAVHMKTVYQPGRRWATITDTVKSTCVVTPSQRQFIQGVSLRALMGSPMGKRRSAIEYCRRPQTCHNNHSNKRARLQPYD